MSLALPITYSATDSSGNTGMPQEKVRCRYYQPCRSNQNPATVELEPTYHGATATDLAAVTVTTSGTVNTDSRSIYTDLHSY